MLHYPENKAVASRYVREAIPMMVKNDIAPNPCNFALWYSYVSKRDRKLCEALDTTLRENGTCPQLTSEELFERFVISDEIEKQQNLQDSLDSVMQDLLDDAKSTRAGTDSYSKNLEASLDALVNDSNPEQLKSTVQQLITATQETNSVVNAFQQQIETAEMEINALRAQLAERERDAATDQLTKIANRRSFDEKLFSLFESDTTKATLVLVDLDYFKKLNDNYGHLIGDKVLQGVAQIMGKVCPANGLAARYGGEEFAFILEDSLAAGFNLAEQVRGLLKKLQLKKKNSDDVIGNITASFGVAEKKPGENPEDLIERADKALYSAKEGGRNRVEQAA